MFSDAWSMAKDAANIIYAYIWHERPSHIVEFGSGRSTIMLADICKRIGSHLVSIEHVPSFLARVQKEINSAGLQKNVTFVHCPLVKVDGVLSYDTYDLGNDVDVSIVDGPPGRTDLLTRWVPLKWSAERFTTAIFMDDTNRRGERAAIDNLVNEYPHLSVELIEAERGLAKITRGSQA